MAAALAAGCGHSLNRSQVEETRVIELMAAEVAQVLAVADNGEIRVRPSPDGDTIRIEATIVARAANRHEAEQALDAVEILTPRTGRDESVQEVRWTWKKRRPLNWSATVSYLIEMPAELPLSAAADNGSIDVEGLLGDRQLETDNGRIRCSDWIADQEPAWDGTLSPTDCTLTAKTDNGSIDVATAAGVLELKSDNGRVYARGAPREVRFSTHNGSIEAQLAHAGRLDGRIETANGGVLLSLNPNASARVACRTQHGNIIVELPNYSGSSGGSAREMTFGVGTTEGLLEIKTNNGPISIRSMSVREEI